MHQFIALVIFCKFPCIEKFLHVTTFLWLLWITYHVCLELVFISIHVMLVQIDLDGVIIDITFFKCLNSTSFDLKWCILFIALPYTLYIFCTKLTLFCRCIAHIRTYRDMYGMKHSPKILCSFAREVYLAFHATKKHEAKHVGVCYVNYVSKNVVIYFFLKIISKHKINGTSTIFLLPWRN